MSEKIKESLHQKNIHRNGYNFEKLTKAEPSLQEFIIANKSGQPSINFADPDAVKALNKALLKTHYDLSFWDIPDGYLCPPIPSRAEYIHQIESLLTEKDKLIRVLDIGTGANCVYPILGSALYNWEFVGSEIDPLGVRAANQIIKMNPRLSRKVEIRMQKNPENIFKGIVRKADFFDLSICNPPFYSSEKTALDATNRKLKNLGFKKRGEIIRNFGGQNRELWTKGGEIGFISAMIKESVLFKDQIKWFSTLVSQKDNLSRIKKILNKVNPQKINTLDIALGQKTSRILAWTFQDLQNTSHDPE